MNSHSYNSLPIEVITALEIRGKTERSYPDFTFYYCLDGHVSVTVHQEPILHRRSDLLLVHPNRKVILSSQNGGRILVLSVARDFFEDYLPPQPLPVISSVLDQDFDYQPMKRLISSIADLAGDSSPKAVLFTRGLLFELLSEISSLLPAEGNGRYAERYADRIEAIAEYIDLHYAENLTLPSVAAAFYLTPQYLSTFFRERFGEGFKTYLTRKRLYYSLRDLRSHEGTISEVALRNGFSSVSAFRKNFQSFYHISPSDYRARYLRQLKESEEEAGSSVPFPGLSLPARSGAEELRQNAVIHAASPVYRAPVQRMINIGSAHNLLSEHYRQHLTEFSARCGIEYVRVQEMLSTSFVPMILPHYEYLFRNVDIALAFLYENHLTPFIELSRLQSHYTTNFSSLEELYYIPRTRRFFRLLESFLMHVTRRWPEDWLNKWKFELWMLPRDTANSYTADFRRIRELVKQYIPEASTGGPGYHASVHPCSPSELLSVFREEHAEPDFFSLNLNYITGNAADGFLISRDTEYPLQTCRKIRKTMAEYSFSIPLYVTEWTSAALFRIPIGISRYQAAFLVKTYLGLDSVCDLAGYWLFIDSIPHITESRPEMFTFGNGLMTSSFMPYAPYFAYEQCASLGRGIIAEGANYRFVKAEENRYQLIAFHYEHFQASADPSVAGSNNFNQVYDIFHSAPAAAFHAVLSGIPNGLYYISKVLMDEQNGSILDIMIEEYTHSNIGKAEFLRNSRILSGYDSSYRQAACYPEERCVYTEVADTLELSVSLPPHSFCVWDIRRQI